MGNFNAQDGAALRPILNFDMATHQGNPLADANETIVAGGGQLDEVKGGVEPPAIVRNNKHQRAR